MSHWNEHAKQWEYIAPPLRPAATDIALATSWVNEIAVQKQAALSVLLLGVTPELVKLSWPAGTKLFVADQNLEMINTVLPVSEHPNKPMAVATCWRALSLATASIDLVIGDGCYNVLTEAHYDEVSQEIVRVLSPTGHFITRLFIRPEQKESLSELQQDVISGSIANFHVFKWRVAMALHGRLEQGVCLKDIWNTCNEQFEINQYWPRHIVHTIDNYKNINTCYTFPTLSEARHKLKHFFAEQKIFFPTYILGECCPSLQFTKIAPR